MKIYLRWTLALVVVSYVAGAQLTWTDIDNKEGIEVALGLVVTLAPMFAAFCAYRYGLLKGIFRGPTRPDDHQTVAAALVRDERLRASLIKRDTNRL